jgi:hypothetical protein
MLYQQILLKTPVPTVYKIWAHVMSLYLAKSLLRHLHSRCFRYKLCHKLCCQNAVTLMTLAQRGAIQSQCSKMCLCLAKPRLPLLPLYQVLPPHLHQTKYLHRHFVRNGATSPFALSTVMQQWEASKILRPLFCHLRNVEAQKILKINFSARIVRIRSFVFYRHKMQPQGK